MPAEGTTPWAGSPAGATPPGAVPGELSPGGMSPGAVPPGRVPAQAATAGRRPDGVIHDIGYQRYTGPRLGRGYAVRSLYVHSVRIAFGLGRSAKAKVFPWLVVGLATVVALVAVAIRAQSHTSILGYREFTDAISFPVLLFLAIVAPELVSRELRAHVLPLYFSRPLRRSDYALAKAAAMITAVWLLLTGPQLLMFIGGAFSRSDGFSGVWDEFGDFLGGVSYAAIVAVAFSTLAVLIASLSGRRAIAATAIAGVFLITAPVALVLIAIGGTVGKIAPIINPVTLMQGLEAWLYRDNTGVDIGHHGYLYGAATLLLVIVYVSLLLARYRKVAA